MKRRGWADDLALLQEVYSTGNLVGVLVGQELAADGVPARFFSFLGWLSILEPVTPGALVEETGMPATTIRDYVREVVDQGHARKKANPEDGRSYLLELTPEGRRLIDAGRPALRRALARIEPHLPRAAEDYVPTVVEVRRAVTEALNKGATRRIEA